MEQLFTTIPLADFKELLNNCIREQFENHKPEPPKDDEFITTNEAIKILGVSKPTLHKWKTEGLIPFYRISSRIRFKKSEIIDAIQTVKKYGRETQFESE